MDTAANQPKCRLRFSVRGILTITAIIALTFAWQTSLNRVKSQLARQAVAFRYVENELDRARSSLNDLRAKLDSTRVLNSAVLNGINLQGVSIVCSGNAFQRTSMLNANFRNATLEAGGAAFQFARFDESNFADAKLIGGSASFQEASFVKADLSRATLTGGTGSFQRASFENANLKDAFLSGLAGSFQLVNISGASFEGADLTAVSSESLSSCYFQVAPTYSDRTKFPVEFDPNENQWRKVP